ncbi:MAG: 50S ribosomal protein L1 [Gammaproteobacteria bacterium]|nr:50S ribosomal protein L1 [Gammaproteobacteria bacterium]MYF58296.1 50S ribosomal protein L1 [Gammaproteobacteria bacterium]MYH33246.1 50S ribosomal protein L1 [Gammaproteobacteria bacterium]MYL02362.1 50S ribosomal protein L1 [Gammaproteobacteria bacterium]
MGRLSKRQKAMRETSGRRDPLPIDEAIRVVRESVPAKFGESVDVAVNLNVDPRKADQIVRGSTVLPHGLGKEIRVAVFADGEAAEAAVEAGADAVGLSDLADEIKGGKIEHDVYIAAPSAMRVVGALGKVLGPRGLMPNPKSGTVTPNVGEAVRNAKAGQVRYRTDKSGIIHCSIGKKNFSQEAILENLTALLNELVKAKPPAAKGVYMQRITLSSTMGPGVRIDQSSIKLQ